MTPETRAQGIARLIPDADCLLALEPEDLAGYVLEYLSARVRHRGTPVSRNNFSLYHTVAGYPEERRKECQYALMEAWGCLEREGLIATEPEQDGWYFITRRGWQMKTRADLNAMRHAALFPRDTMHPEIVRMAYPLYLRGEYETAIFQAFKTIEVQVREAAGLSPSMYGVTLMRKAFHPESGPLTDTTEPAGEREALQHLCAGAVGRFKNPSSHRHISMTSPAETVEVLAFASHLLRIVDERKG